ncbi:hypothetical protein HJB56_08550 [Rhizobium lentis]|uniref:hypothetical protein n=1 Tax=Rhizobium lentis TaxID=1138194 RepID=UPI001C83DB41|nr:hypothetical protein [Rhizobium lentis]MBX5082809.1 hypothetical protein [Rhizobium lentis]MBX5096050.1 hypothetical protein [Rhizobium lentis]MBX5120102.1 hypothetical protein [Rhizobium lentis]
MIEFNSRRDQFSFFLGFVTRTKGKQLQQELDKHLKGEDGGSPAKEAFDVCPFNDRQEQIIRSYHIFENGRPADFAFNLGRLLGEYLFLVSDFVPKCCGDGRTFYCQSGDGDVVLECDRCGTVYALNEEVIQKTNLKKMRKNDFVALVGEAEASDWPYHLKLQVLLARCKASEEAAD